MALPLALLPGLAFAADVASRQEAIRGGVISEPDYMSTWLTTLRNNWRMLGGTGFTRMQTLPKPAESLTGCDAILILESDDPDPFKKYWKILLIESKRLKPVMDYLQKPTNTALAMYPKHRKRAKISHFSDQIGRQHNFQTNIYPGVAICEMFQNFEDASGPYPRPFEVHGSSFVPHEYAWTYVNTTSIKTTDLWTTNHVESMSGGGASIDWVINKMLECKLGHPMNVTDLHVLFRKVIGKEFVRTNDLPQLPGDRFFQELALALSVDYAGRFVGHHNWPRH